jgi:hypothetical protein
MNRSVSRQVDIQRLLTAKRMRILAWMALNAMSFSDVEGMMAIQ